MSDLQSPYLGVMERNLAIAFEDAIRNDAILQIDEVDSFLRSREMAKQAWEISQVNEFLTQLESFEGIFIATTNLVHGIDSAALRRFDHKVHLDYLRDGQLRSVVSEKLTEWGLCHANETRIASRVACLNGVSMGDIAALSRRHKLSAFVSAEDFIDALAEEVRLKGGVTNRMGFL
jgi:SpoVK/Ycf46/Vps4 family AAA+-type ATPase